MSKPIVITHHLIWTGYGWWLPNDPRGSGSHVIRRDVLAELGEIHHGRKAVQPTSAEIRSFQDQAAGLLSYPRLSFHANEIAIIGEAFAEVIEAHNYTCYECAIMPDHIHILLRKHKHQAEEMIERLKECSGCRLREASQRFQGHPTWASGTGWKVFLDHPVAVRRTMAYIAKNPESIGGRTQDWSFVTHYDDWPLHPGHSPNSPYVKRLRAAGRYR